MAAEDWELVAAAEVKAWTQTDKKQSENTNRNGVELVCQQMKITGAGAAAGAAASGSFGSAAFGVAFGCVINQAVSSQ